MAHKWAKWLRHLCHLGHAHCCRAGGGGESEVPHLWAKWLRHPCRLGDPHRLRAGGGNQKWATSGQTRYVTPAVSGIPTAAERGAKSEVAHLWAKWLRHPCRLGDPHRCRAGEGNEKWPTSGQSGYVTSAISGMRTAAERGGGESEVPHLWAKWPCHPCRLGDPHRCRAGEGNEKWPTSGQSGYVTSAISGMRTAAERGGGESEVPHLWAKWLRHPCRLGDPHRLRAGGGGIRSGPQVGKLATSPLPSRGSPPLQSGGQNQKWPTCGQSGYVTPAVSEIPTAAERGGGIRSGPLLGKVAMSPLPSRGSPPLQSGGGK